VATGKNIGDAKITPNERASIAFNILAGLGGMMAAAFALIWDDDSEKSYDSQPQSTRKGNMSIKSGAKFDYYDKDGNFVGTFDDYIQIPTRDVFSMANSFSIQLMKFIKRHNQEQLEKGTADFAKATSPLNLSGETEQEVGQSALSNLTSIPKWGMEYMNNIDYYHHTQLFRDTHSPIGLAHQVHRTLLSYDFLNKRDAFDEQPWLCRDNNTPQWAVDMSKSIKEESGISITPIALNLFDDAMMGNFVDRNIMGNNPLMARIKRSRAQYPVVQNK
jgi:hypothetical protein